MKGKKIGILIGVSAVVVAVGASVTVTQQNEYKLIRQFGKEDAENCLLYTSPSPRD